MGGFLHIRAGVIGALIRAGKEANKVGKLVSRCKEQLALRRFVVTHNFITT
jgi:hypothetical protein